MIRKLVGWLAVLLAVITLGIATSILGLAPIAVSTSATVISEVRTTNVRDNTFVVSWVTDQTATGEVHYGTDASDLNQTAEDDRGAGTNDDTHYVTLMDLSPETTYYFDIVSGGTTDDNGGAHYTVTMGPVLSPPASDTIYGQVFKADGTTPAEGAIVYITLRDADGSDSSGEAAPLSSLVDDTGYWHASLGNARTPDLSSYFSYSVSGDEVELVAQGAGDGTASQVVDTANDFPAGDMVLVLGADLSVAKVDDPDPVNAGDTLTYTLTVSNTGPISASNVTVTDTLPSNVTFNSAAGTGWSCSETDGTMTCTRANLDVGTAPDISITITAPSDGGSITNQAEVSSDAADPDSGNNTASEDTTVTAQADLSITKTDDPDPVNASGTLTYTLTVNNAGPSTGTAVTVTDTLPSGVTFINATGADWTCAHVSGIVTCDRTSLNAGTASEITITVTAPSSEGSITNQVEVGANTADPDSGDNTASISTTVAAPGSCPDYNNQPGVVDLGDLQYLATQWRQPPPPPLYYDCDDDGEITVVDLICVASILGDSCTNGTAP